MPQIITIFNRLLQALILQGYHKMHSNSKQKQYRVKISIRADIWIITGSDQRNRKKKRKMSSTGKVKD